MPRNGAGTFVPPSNSWNPAVGGTTISSTDFAAQLSDLASGLTTSIASDGQTPITANLPIGGFKITGAADGSAATDCATVGQLQSNLVGWVIAGGTANAITAAYSPAIASLTDGLLLAFRAASANTTTTPTFAPNSLTAHTITKQAGGALQAGDIIGNLAEYLVRYNLANTRWELLNPSSNNIVGTFTPTLGDGTNNFAASSALGWYTKNGNIVFAFFTYIWTSLGSAGASQLALGNLPFASASDANSRYAATLGNINGVDNGGGKQVIANLDNSSASLLFYLVNDNSSTTNIAANAQSTSGVLTGTLIYRV